MASATTPPSVLPPSRAGSKKAGRRVTYIDGQSVRIPEDKFRAALGRFWNTGPNGAKYGVDIPDAISPFFASVGPTRTLAGPKPSCPFVERGNSISVTPNPDVFRGVNGAESFKIFMTGGRLADFKFEPFNNLTPEQFSRFVTLFDIKVRTTPSGDRGFEMAGILNFCQDFQRIPPTETGPPEIDRPLASMGEGVGGDAMSSPASTEYDDLIIGEVSDDLDSELLDPDAGGPGGFFEGVGDTDSGQQGPDSELYDPQDPDAPADFFDPDSPIQPGFDPIPRPQPQPEPKDCCDTTFDIMTPFPPEALEYFEAQNNVVFSGLTFSYNYSNEVYNTFAADPSVAEKDLPNLYTTLTDGDAGRFLRTARSKVACDNSMEHILNTVTGHQHLLATADTTIGLERGVPYSEFFPYHADLQFTTDREAEFGDVLARRRLDGIMLRRFAQGPKPGDFCNTPPTVRTPEKIKKVGISSQVIEADVPSKTVRVRGNYGTTDIKEIDFCEWFDKTEACVTAMETPSALNERARFIRPTPAPDAGNIDSADIAIPGATIPLESAAQVERYAEYGMFKMMAAEHANRNFGGYRQLLADGVNHSETLAYKVQKWDAATYRLYKDDPAGSYQPLQEFYFSNTRELDFIHYIDTQIKYNAGYVYEVVAYEMVLGTEYRYEMAPPCGDEWQRQIRLNTGLLSPFLGPAAATPPPAVQPLVDLINILIKYKNGIISYAQSQTQLRAWLNAHYSLLNSPSVLSRGTLNPCPDRDIGAKFELNIDGIDRITLSCLCEDTSTRDPQTPDAPSYDVLVRSSPCIKIYEVPYFVQQGRLLEHPPVRPLVDLIPFRAVNNQMLINLSNGMGVESQIPIHINPGEQLLSEERQKTENYIRQKVDYRSHPGGLPPAGFEVYRTVNPPKNYQDFAGNLRAFVSTDFDKASRQNADAASFIDDMVPNQKYYYTFRTIGSLDIYQQFGEYVSELQEVITTEEEIGSVADLSTPERTLIREVTADRFGHLFSNPTPVYEVELVDDDGAVYLLVRTVDFDILHPPPTTKTMKRLIHVKPSITQSIINPRFNDAASATELEAFAGDNPFAGPEYSLEPKYESAIDAVTAGGGNVLLGAESKLVWGKTYKVRLTSKKTCRKIDFNITFDRKHIDTGQCPSVTIVGVPYDSEEEVS